MSAHALKPRFHRSRLARALRSSLVAACLIAGVAAADEIPLDACPEPVRAMILAHIQTGKIDEIKKVEIGDRALYLVEIDLKGFRHIKLQIRGDGTLQKSVEEIRYNDLPPSVRAAVAPFVAVRGRVHDVARVVVEGEIRYQVEIKRPKMPDLDLVFDVEGSVLSQK